MKSLVPVTRDRGKRDFQSTTITRVPPGMQANLHLQILPGFIIYHPIPYRTFPGIVPCTYVFLLPSFLL